jgi:glycosyltransferase involved in cell wall biosynthesis
MRQIAEHLRLNVFWKRRVTNEVRNALYQLSRCVVYPSIHREPFGLVAAEAMSHGTPVVVPDQGGITEVVEVNGRRGGLTFKSWDSGDLADQLARLLSDESLNRELRDNAPSVAEYFSIDQLVARVLDHIGLQPSAKAPQTVGVT